MNVDKTICENCGNWVDGLDGEPWNHSCPPVGCAMCNGPVDTREGNDHGCQIETGWVCSRECYYHAVPDVRRTHR